MNVFAGFVSDRSLKSPMEKSIFSKEKSIFLMENYEIGFSLIFFKQISICF